MGNPKLTFNVALRRYGKHVESLGWSHEWQRVVFVFLNSLEKCAIQAAQERGHPSYREPRVTMIDDEVTDRYFAQYRDKSQASRNNAFTAYKGFVNWLKANRQLKPLDVDRMLSGRGVKRKNRKPKQYIPASDFQLALDLSGKRHAADRAAFAVALYTLCRVGEITSLQLQDIDMDRRTIQVYRSKRKRWTEVTMCDELHAELETWLEYYAWSTKQVGPAVMKHDHPDWYLIPRLAIKRQGNAKGRYDAALQQYAIRPSEPSRGLENVVKGVLDGLGVEGSTHSEWSRHVGEGMHTIRRSGARAMLDHLSKTDGNDKALLKVSLMLDHEDTQITLSYIGMEIEKKQLDDYLRNGGSMYGKPADDGQKVTDRSNVLQFRPRKIG